MIYNAQYEQELHEIIDTTNKVACGKRLTSKRFKHLQEYVYSCTTFLDGYDVNFMTRVWHTLNHSTTLFTCQTCGEILKSQNVRFPEQTHRRFCSPRCECMHPDVKATLNATNLKKYGVEWTLQSDSSRSKTKATMQTKYGVDYAQQNKSIKEKSFSTMKEKYGSKYPLQNIEIKERAHRSALSNTYDKFLSSQYVTPLFTRDEYLLHGNAYVYDWKCVECGSIFKSMKNDSWFKQGPIRAFARCEHCYPYVTTVSQSEKEIREFLDSMQLLYDKNTRKIIQPLELDIYIPEKKLAVEFDGLYWHADDLAADTKYHLQKTEACEAKGIQLIHIFENEWKFKREIVKSRLKIILGMFDKTIYARKCEARVVDSKTSREFQEQNHIQGAVNSSVNLGLFCNDELVSLMTFSKTRFSKKYEWELVRFCNKLGHHIPGAASKLLKHFERNWKPESLVSYADRRWSQGKLYEALGFQLDHKSRPDYWYWKNVSLLESRIKYQKHKLKTLLPIFDETKTEVQNMMDNGYHRIFDCGNLVFVKKYAEAVA